MDSCKVEMEERPKSIRTWRKREEGVARARHGKGMNVSHPALKMRTTLRGNGGKGPGPTHYLKSISRSTLQRPEHHITGREVAVDDAVCMHFR